MSKDKGKKDGYKYLCRVCSRHKYKEYRANNLIKERARVAKRDRDYPEMNAARARKRRAVKRGLPYVAYTAQEILTRDNAVCCLCGFGVDTSNFHIEHIVPLQVDPQLLLSYGIHEHPGDVPWNVSIAHPSCNSSKAHRMTQEDHARYLLWSYLYKE